MEGQIKTVKVKCKATDENPAGYYLINECDLTDAHALFDEADAGDTSVDFSKLGKKELQEYLSKSGIAFEVTDSKATLLELCEQPVAASGSA